MESKADAGSDAQVSLGSGGRDPNQGVTLSERLYVPEQFHEEQKWEIAERRRCKLAVLQSPKDDVQF
jgi:hypothetical protein